MKKIMVLLLAAVMSLGLVFVGCSSSETHYSNGLSGFEGTVESNGGFAVTKGDYVYFINGVASNTDDNTFGKPITGALVRMKKSDLADAADRTKAAKSAELVIPSLFVAGDLTGGFFMFNDDNNVYFASPYTEKDKEGNVENDRLSFVRASLDGKERKVLLSVDDNTTPYRYVENNGKVYLVIKTVVPDERSDDDDATRAAIVAYDASNGEKIFTSEEVSEYDFGEGNDIYYTVTAYDEKLEQDEKYNDLYRYVAGNTASELVLSGKGNVSTDSATANGTGLTGVTYSIVENASDAIYLKLTYVDTSVTTVTQYKALEKANVTADSAENKGKLISLNNGSSSASSVFASTSLFASVNCILYLDSDNGIVVYNYAKENSSTGDVVVDHRIRLFYDEDLVGYTVKFWQDGYLYTVDSNNYYYRVNVAALVDFATGEKKAGAEGKLERVNFLANSTSWYLPEIIDGKYFLSIYTASPYSSLVYVSDMEANAAIAAAKDADEQIEAIQASEKEEVEKNLSTCVSLISESVKNSMDEYIEDTFDTEDEE